MISVTEEKKKELLKNYSFEKLINIIENDSEFLKEYKFLTISIYDHFLDEKEADENLMSYVCIDSKDVDKLKKFYEIEKKYLNFFLEIYSKNEIIYFDIEKKDIFFNFKDIIEFKKICIENIREKKLFNLSIPSKESLLIGSFDLNTIVYYKKNIKWIEVFLKKNGLFLIN